MEPSPALETARQILFSISVILASGVLSGLLAQKTNVPDVVIFLLAGILLGPEVSGLLQLKADSAANQIVLIFGSCYILFDGGAAVRLKVLKEVCITLFLLATAGVVVTAALTGLAAQYIFGVPLITALLLGATIAPTDPATLVPLLKQIRIKDRVSQLVMSESAFNDAVGALLTLAVFAIASGGAKFSAGSALMELLKQSAMGILAGLISGYLASLLIAHERYAFLAEYAPVVTLMAVLGAYLGAEGLHASGFMAVFVFGIVMGNKESLGFSMSRVEHNKLDEYVVITAFIMRMFIFILLGSQVNFSLMGQYITGGVLLVTFFMAAARPLAVFLSSLPDRRAKWSLNEILFICWTRETGVIPAALAGLLYGMKAPGSQMIASVTFVAILMTILIQATTTRWLAKKLDLLIE